MTRKHYVAIAKIISEQLVDGKDKETLEAVSKALSSVLKEDNRAFDKERFLTACGL